MKRFLVVLFSLIIGAMSLALSACAGNTENGQTGGTGGTISGEGNILVVYFSATGNTEEVAGYIADAAGGDIFEIEPVDAYTAADLRWTDENSRVVQEYENPELRDIELVSATVENWAEYDTVLIGYPIWWGIAAWPVNGFVEANDFTGKTVIPFYFVQLGARAERPTPRAARRYGQLARGAPVPFQCVRKRCDKLAARIGHSCVTRGAAR